MRLRVILDFEAPHPEGSPAPLAALRGFLGAMVEHQEFGTRLGVRDLEALGLGGVRLVSAELQENPPAAGQAGG